MVSITLAQISHSTGGDIDFRLEHSLIGVLFGMSIHPNLTFDDLVAKFSIEDNCIVSKDESQNVSLESIEMKWLTFPVFNVEGIRVVTSIRFKDGMIFGLELRCISDISDIPIIIDGKEPRTASKLNSNFQQKVERISYTAISMTDPRLDQSSSLIIEFPNKNQQREIQGDVKSSILNILYKLVR